MKEGFVKSLFLTAAGLAAGLAVAGAFNIMPLGHGPLNGDSPNTSDRVFPNPAQYFTIVYMKMQTDSSGNPSLKVRHAFFDAAQTGNTMASINDEVGKLIVGRFRTETYSGGNSSQIGIEPIPGYNGPVYNDFSNFNFGCPIRIYVIIDNEGLDFEDKWPIMFSDFGSEDRKVLDNNKWRKLDKNRTFYNVALGGVTKADLDGVPGIRRSKLVYFENHFRKSNLFGIGESMAPSCYPKSQKEKPFEEYSINFNLKMSNGSGTTIPIVIDPDTSNGNGSPPPVKP